MMLLLFLLVSSIVVCKSVESSDKDSSQSTLRLISRRSATKPNLEDMRKMITDIKSKMDTTVDPCFDFYEYACGNFEKTTASQALKDKITVELDKALTRANNRAQSEAERKAKKLYTSCINLMGKCPQTFDQINRFLGEFGEWPLIVNSNFSHKNFDWLNRVAKLRRYGVQSLLYESVQYVSSKQRNAAIIIAPNPMDNKLTEKDFIEGTTLVNKFLNDVISKFAATGLLVEKIKKDIQDIHKFQIGRSRILKDWTLNFVDVTTITYKDFKRRFTDRDWDDFFQTISGRHFNYLDKIHVLNEKLLLQLIEYYDCIKPEILANYMFYKLLQKLQSIDVKNHDTCIADTVMLIPHAVSAIYIQEYYDSTTKKQVSEIVEYVKMSLNELLTEAKWMDNSTKQEALLKLNKITPIVGYFEQIQDSSWIDDAYENIVIDHDDFITSAFRILEQRTSLEHHVSNSIQDDDFYTDINLLDPYVTLIPERNFLVVPSSLQKFPFFSLESSNALNFGALGSQIGHELIHAVDAIGKKYDSSGKIHNWWTKTTEINYQNASKCFIEFYGNYTFSSIYKTKINGKKTLIENIADNGGMHLAYLAYSKWFLDKHVEWMIDDLIPDIKLSAAQLFFLGYAQSLCEWRVYRELLIEEHKNFPHSPAKFRVLGSLANFDQFAKEFNCSKASNMNPTSKCNMW